MSLSKAESNVIVYVQKGYSNDQIATQLNVSTKTIKFHLTNIFKKYGVKSRAELTASMNGYSSKIEGEIMSELTKKEPAKALTQQEKVQFIDKQFHVGKAVNQLHSMMTEVTKDEINPATVNAACNCVARLNETINTAITAARFLNER